jgi:uncharacterized protein (TIGR00369 family)
MEQAPPEGFSLWTRGSAVTVPWDPIYVETLGHSVHLGTFLRPAICNSRGSLHGGVIATLCDIAMGHSCANVARKENPDIRHLVTTHLAVDFVGSAESGWIDIRSRVIHAGAKTGIADAIVFADDHVIARATASFRAVRDR